MSAQAVEGEPLSVRGRLEYDGPAPAEPLKPTATRTDAHGTHDLGTFTVKEDGSYTVLDEPDLVGDATRTVSYLGDLTHTVSVGKAPTSIALTAPAQASISSGAEITGTFTINDIPRTRRETTYTVSRPGDDLHEGSTASATVYVTR